MRLPERICPLTPIRFPEKLPFDPSLVLNISMNEGTGTKTFDQTIFGNHGTITDGSWKAQGKIGSGIEFNGTSSYINCGNDPSLNITDAITIEAWVKRIATSRVAFSKGVYNSDGWYIDFDLLGQIVFKLNEAGNHHAISSSAGTVPDGVWTHMVIVVDNGNTVSFYFDGSFDKSEAMDFSYIGNVDRHLIIGAYDTIGSIPFNGTIDEVRIYNRALSAGEIMKRFLQTNIG